MALSEHLWWWYASVMNLALQQLIRKSLLVTTVVLFCQPLTVSAFSNPRGLQPLIPGHNNADADRINLIIVGTGYASTEQFLATARRDIAFDTAPILDRNEHVASRPVTNLSYGVFAIEPFRANKAKFNIWYYPTQVTTTSALTSQYSNASQFFDLPFSSVIFFRNPAASPGSSAFPSNVPAGLAIEKQSIQFGVTTVDRYPNVIPGADVVAHELGHSLFNLRDEYLSPARGTIFGHNCARSQAEAQTLWGSVVGQVDPFYYEWKASMQTYGLWVATSATQAVNPKDGSLMDNTHNPSEDEMRVGYVTGGCLQGDAVMPTQTSLMSNSASARFGQVYPPVFGSANRRVIENVLGLFAGSATGSTLPITPSTSATPITPTTPTTSSNPTTTSKPAVSSDCSALTLNMQKGARDVSYRGQVSALQRYLSNRFGVNSADIVTGYFGPMTMRFVLQLQKEKSLPATGIVGPLTRSAIASSCGKAPLDKRDPSYLQAQ